MLASEAVARAYRESQIKGIGTTPTTDEYTEGLARLNGFLFSLFGHELGEQLFDFQVPANQRSTTIAYDNIVLNYPQNLSAFDQPLAPGIGDPQTGNPITIPANVRVVWRGSAATTVYLPEYPGDGAQVALADSGSTADLTLNANGRLIEGTATKVLTTPAAASRWFYRADLANWISIAPLALTDTTPLPVEFDDLLVSGTAIRLTALDGIKPSEGTLFIYERLLKLAKQRYYQRSNTSYGGQNLVNADQSFDTFGGTRQW